MSKLSYKDKIKIYNARKSGTRMKDLTKKYGVRRNVINYLVCLIDRHGIEIIHSYDKRKSYSITEKEKAVKRVLEDGETAYSVAIDIGLPSSGMLQNWIRNYKDNGNKIVEKRKKNI